jgi:ethanolaminephosphotransferase
VDGKQARRTGTSSPLGELFDHGCDALNCSFGALVFSAALGMGHTYSSAALLLLLVIPFFFSTWEEYHTGVLYLGYFNGPTEGLLIACILQLTSAIAGIQTKIIIFFLLYKYLFNNNRPRMVDSRFTRFT